MRVLKRGNLAEPRRITCDRCGAEIEYTIYDLDYDLDGRGRFECPDCGNVIYTSEDADDDRYGFGHIPVYPKNGEKDFFFFKDGVDISCEKINEWIEKICDEVEHTPEDELRENGFTRLYATGNTLVFACGSPVDGEPLAIYVTKDYAEANYFLK